MADSVLDLILRIKKSGSGGKETDKELNALGQSVKRVKQEFKDFKQIGQATGQAFSLVTKSIAAVADSAEHLGRTELKKAFAEASEAGQDLQDTLVTMKAGGRDAISWVTDAATGLKNLADLVNISGIAFAQMTGRMSDADAAARANALVYKDVALTSEQLAQAQIDMADPMDESNRLLRDQKTALEELTPAQQAAIDAAEHEKEVTDKLAFSMGDLNQQTLFAAASEGLSADAKFELAEKMGLVSDAAAVEWDHLQNLKAAYDTNKDGIIDLTEATNGYIDAAGRLALAAIFTRDQLIAMTQEANNATGGSNGQYGGAIDDSTDANHATGTGGVMVVPPGYPNDSYRVGLTSGEPYWVGKPGQTTNTTNMGGVTINISGAGDPSAVAREVKRQLENAGRSADARMRVG